MSRLDLLSKNAGIVRGIVGKTGVDRVIELELDAGERDGLHASAELLRDMRRSQPETDGE